MSLKKISKKGYKRGQSKAKGGRIGKQLGGGFARPLGVAGAAGAAGVARPLGVPGAAGVAGAAGPLGARRFSKGGSSKK